MSCFEGQSNCCYIVKVIYILQQCSIHVAVDRVVYDTCPWVTKEEVVPD